MRGHLNSTHLATAVCCVGVVAAGLLIQAYLLRVFVAALCISFLLYRVSVCGSRMQAARLLLLNSGLLAMICALLRVALPLAFRHFHDVFWPGFHRMYLARWLSECSAIILALLAAGLAAVEVAGKMGGDVTRKRFQSCVIAAASILVTVNVVHFLRPVWCYDCFFPYGLPFTLFTEGGYGGGGGIVWLGLLADAALIPMFATICTRLWNQIAQ